MSPLAPLHTALLVMDYEPTILSGLDGVEDLLDRMAGAIDTVRDRGGHVAYVRVGFTAGDFDAIPEHHHMASAAAVAREHFDADGPGTQVHPDLAPADGDIVVRKVRVGAFSTTDLDQRLRALGLSTLLLAGISTSGVVLSTVRDAVDRNYRVIVLADGCADPNAEVHRLLLEELFPQQAEIANIADLDALLGP